MSWLDDNIWVVVVIAVVVVIIISFAIWYFCRRSQSTPYSRLELGVNEAFDESTRLKQKEASDSDFALELRYYLRDKNNMSLIRVLPQIGERTEKRYALLKCTDTMSPHKQIILSVMPRPDGCLFAFAAETERMLESTLKRIQYPFILPLIHINLDPSKNAVFVFYPYKSAGSLRDLIHNCNPDYEYRSKYSTLGVAPSEQKIAVFGRQILEALRYLEFINVPYYHLTAGNIIMDNGVCQLTGIELTLLGVRPSVHEHLARLVKKNPAASPVLQFGHVLFEMAHGFELDSPTPEYISNKVPRKVADAIEFIFRGVNVKEGIVQVPTIQEVLEHPFFADALYQLRKSDLTFRPPALDADMTAFVEAVRDHRRIELTGPTKRSAARKASSKRALSKPALLSTLDAPQTTVTQAPGSVPSALNYVPSSPSAKKAPGSPSMSATTSAAPPTPKAAPAAAPPAPKPAAAAPAPPPAPKTPATPAPPPPPVASSEGGEGRSSLLASINGFKGGLKKVKTNDRSKPTV